MKVQVEADSTHVLKESQMNRQDTRRILIGILILTRPIFVIESK